MELKAELGLNVHINVREVVSVGIPGEGVVGGDG